jgi:2-polyprenyl-3-methyl-5-hydroxy-6-metoxy-1,4-benzoquinol methylase
LTAPCAVDPTQNDAVTGEPRYVGELADWYDDWIAAPDVDPVAQGLFRVMGEITGERLLDLACGQGRIARHLAVTGNEVVGVELSADMLGHALDTDGVTYVNTDVTNTAWWDGTPFDGVVCSMALMDIDDLAGAVRTAATVLRPGGWFAWSITHPAFPGIDEVRSSWPMNGSYFDEVFWFTDGLGLRGRVGINHRTLSTYLNTVASSGFVLEETHEPRWRLSDDHPWMPFFLVTRWRRQ